MPGDHTGRGAGEVPTARAGDDGDADEHGSEWLRTVPSTLHWDAKSMSFPLGRNSVSHTVSVPPFKALRVFCDLYPELDTAGMTKSMSLLCANLSDH